MNKENQCEKWGTTFTTESPVELEKVYDGWASEYDLNVQEMGYTTTAIVAGLTCRYLQEKKCAILDAGVGTGIIGEKLSVLGYKELAGIDISDGMLLLARKKGIYKKLEKMVLGEHLDFPDHIFDAVVSSGVFTVGHAPANGFDELARITKSGGFVIIGIRFDKEDSCGFRHKMKEIEKEGRWRLIEETDPFQCLPIAEPHVMNQVFVCKIV